MSDAGERARMRALDRCLQLLEDALAEGKELYVRPDR